jgi:TRAP-type C4-dicarboxylate transport system permease small subunit
LGGQYEDGVPLLKRFNDGLARGEAALAVGMLLLMLVVAFAQAALRNLTLAGVTWANAALDWLSWGDFVMQKGTLWLAFLGASLAVHADKHVAIDLLPRVLSPRGRIIMRGIVGLIGSVICFYLARAFWDAILINGQERPAEVEILTMEGAVHVCDANAAQLAESSSRPGVYCAVRGFFKALGVQMDTPGAAFQLISPVMLMFMCVRMAGMGIHQFVRVARGDITDDLAEHGLAGAATDVAHDLEDKGGDKP